MRRRTARAILLGAAGAALAAAGPASANTALSAGAAEPAIVAVWALADGDTPLAGAHVRILKDGAVLRQDNGTRRELTSRAGVSLLDLRRLPRRFIVEVVPRQRLGGSFRALVRGYRAGAVVHVNPVTTLIADVLTAHRRRGRAISLARARREAFRLLAIPRWHDHADLRYSDTAFDGDTYLRAARKAGGVAALNRTLVQRVLEDEGRRRFRDRRKYARASAGPEAFVEKAFLNLLTFAGKTAGEVAAKQGAEAALGWLLAGFGLNDNLVPQQLTEIRSTLDAIGKQLTELKNDVARAELSALVSQTNETIAQINHAAHMLDVLAKIPEGDKTKGPYAQTAVDWIGSNLIDTPEFLDRSLTSDAPLADNLIKSASRRVKSQTGRFFENIDSAQARSVYEYFATYETRLAILLTEYYHARPDVYSPQTTQAEVTRLKAMVDAQAQSVQRPVPSGAVIDTETGLMWTQRFKSHSLSEFARIQTSSNNWKGNFLWRSNRFGLPDLPFTNWSLPTAEQVNRLIAGWSNVCCSLGWLQTVGGFGPMTAPIILYHDNFYRYSPASDQMEVSVQVYDLLHDKLVNARASWTSTENWQTNQALGEGALKLFVATAIKVRPPAPGETYWWQ